MAAPADQRSLPETILVWFLQVLGAVTAILFGTFGILSWQMSEQANAKSDLANTQSDTANLVALVALCAQLGSEFDSSGIAGLCNGVQIAASATLSEIASSFFGTIPTPTSVASSTDGATATSSSADGSTSTGSSPSTTDSGSSAATPTSGQSSSGVGELSSAAKLGIGLALGVGFTLAVISGLTIWAARKRKTRCREMEEKGTPDLPPSVLAGLSRRAR